jgi:hypothetical protein
LSFYGLAQSAQQHPNATAHPSRSISVMTWNNMTLLTHSNMHWQQDACIYSETLATSKPKQGMNFEREK